MSKDTKKNIKGTDNRKNTNSKIPKNLKTQDRQNAMKRISKTRQAKMREEEVKSTLKFGVKLVLVLAVVIGCAQLFFYGKNVMADRSNGPAAWIAAENSQTKDNPSDSSGLSKTCTPCSGCSFCPRPAFCFPDGCCSGGITPRTYRSRCRRPLPGRHPLLQRSDRTPGLPGRS